MNESNAWQKAKKIVANYSKLFLTAFKWVIFIASLLFLVKLFTDLSENSAFFLNFSSSLSRNYFWLILVFALLPLNWLSEVLKWRQIVSIKQRLSLPKAFRAFFAGTSTAFFSPNRTGEFIGRGLHLNKELRPLLIPFNILNSLTQNFILILLGFPAAILFFVVVGNNKVVNAQTIGITVLVLFTIVVLLWLLWQFVIKKSSVKWVKNIVFAFGLYRKKDIFFILIISFVRYLIFSMQFYFMLRFFDINLSIYQAFLAIPTNYLFVTLTPAFAFSEAGVRGALAVLIIGTFSQQATGIALAAILIWLVNFVIPMLIGSVVIFTQKFKE